MKIINRIPVLALAVLLVAAVQSCKKDESSPLSSNDLKSQGTNIFYGPTVPIGNGTARAWVQVDGNGNGNPMAVGIDLSDQALVNLPDVPTSWVLYFPRNKGLNFYKHMLVDWNPHGHEPIGIYDKPHFDFHFYYITNEERLLIGPPGAPGFDSLPAAQYIPPMYLKIPGGVPQMGAHWADLLSPEFNGGEFTKTFIWGSWMGSFIFFEPMITKAYLETQPDETADVRQPAAFAEDGWYPTSYRVAYSTSPKQYTISLEGLTFHSGQ